MEKRILSKNTQNSNWVRDISLRGRPLIIWGVWCKTKKKIVRRVAEKNATWRWREHTCQWHDFYPELQLAIAINYDIFYQLEFWQSLTKFWSNDTRQCSFEFWSSDKFWSSDTQCFPKVTRVADHFNSSLSSEDQKFEIRCTHARTSWDPNNAFPWCAIIVGHMSKVYITKVGRNGPNWRFSKSHVIPMGKMEP